MENSKKVPHPSWMFTSHGLVFFVSSSPLLDLLLSLPHLAGLWHGSSAWLCCRLAFPWVGILVYTTLRFAPHFSPGSPRALLSGCFSSIPPFSAVLLPFYLWQPTILLLISVTSLTYHVHFFPPKPACWPSLQEVLCWKLFLLWTSEPFSTPPPTFPCSLSFSQILSLEVLAPHFLGLVSLLQLSFFLASVLKCLLQSLHYPLLRLTYLVYSVYSVFLFSLLRWGGISLRSSGCPRTHRSVSVSQVLN